MDIRNGSPDGRKKANASDAREYLFRKAFLRFAPVDETQTLDLGSCKSEVEFFLTNAPRLVDRVNIEYLNKTYPDIDLGK